LGATIMIYRHGVLLKSINNINHTLISTPNWEAY
jgi:hypothetical protein